MAQQVDSKSIAQQWVAGSTPVSSALAGCELSQPAVFFGISRLLALTFRGVASRFCAANSGSWITLFGTEPP